MHWFKRNPIFFTILVLLGLAFAVELVLLVQERRNVEEARQTYRNKVDDYERLRNHDPSITRENVELAREDLERVEENLATIKEALGADTDLAELFGDPPADSTDLVLELTAFAEEYRDKAAASGGEEGEGIRIDAQEFFGFSQYRRSGPPDALVEDIYRQRQIAGYLLDTLFAANPLEFAGIQRGPVDAASGGGGDIFNIPEGVSARIPGFVETYPFRLTFVGRTRALRSFLNRLAAFEMPILVRSVEVVPAGSDGGRRQRRGAQQNAGGAASAEAGAVPIVESALSRFVVTVEFVELVSSEDESGDVPGEEEGEPVNGL